MASMSTFSSELIATSQSPISRHVIPDVDLSNRKMLLCFAKYLLPWGNIFSALSFEFTSLVKLPSDGIDNIAYGRTASRRSMLTKFSSLYCFWFSSSQNIPRWGLSVKIVSLLHTIRLHSLIHTFSVYCYCASNVKRYAEKWHCEE